MNTSPARDLESHYWVSGFPQLALEWDRESNGPLTPNEISAGSGRRVCWRCPAGPDHVWRASPNNRTNGTGCPFCANRRASVTNSLAALFPDTAREWHPSKNGALTPSDIVASSTRVCVWQCAKNPDHEWRASVRDRTRDRTRCPYCARRRRVPPPESHVCLVARDSE